MLLVTFTFESWGAHTHTQKAPLYLIPRRGNWWRKDRTDCFVLPDILLSAWGSVEATSDGKKGRVRRLSLSLRESERDLFILPLFYLLTVRDWRFMESQGQKK